MTNIVVDPYILAFPNNEAPNSIEFEDYVMRILDINSIIKRKELNFYLSRNTSKILAEQYNYPEWDKVTKYLEENGLRGTFQPQDIVLTIESILKCTEIESILEIDEVLYDNVVITPNEIEENRTDIYLEELRQLLIYLRISEHLGYDSILATVDLDYTNINVVGEVIGIEPDRSEMSHLIRIHSGTTKTFHSIDSLYDQLDPVNLWKKATIESEYKLAFKTYIFQRERKYLNGKNWAFGSSFFKNMLQYGFLHEHSKIKSLFRSMANTIFYENNRNTHPLRTDSGGNAPQITRGSDKAWRRDIDYEYHLHYWECEDHFEFSRLVVHNNMKISK